jgi:hypothetical protein
MEPPNLNDPFEAFSRFDSILDDAEGDLTLTVLKGHLLIEEQLRALLIAASKSPAAIDEANLRFSQMLSLVKALYNDDSLTRIWNAIKALNSLRNQLAHRLEPRDVERRVTEFAKVIVEPPNNEGWTKDGLLAALNQGLGYIYAAVSRIPRSSNAP